MISVAFFVRHGLAHRPRAAAIFGTLVVVMLLLVRSYRSATAARREILIQVALAAMVITCTLLAAIGGGIQSVALWFIGLVPLAATHMAGVRAGRLWMVPVLVAIGGVTLADTRGWLSTEFVPHLFELTASRIAFGFLLLASALSFRKTTDNSLKEAERLAAELRARAADLEEARDAALAASKVKSEFLATMSHEIRTPLNAIQGITHVLTDSPLSDDQRDWVGTIRKSGDSLLVIINDILDFSKIEAGRFELGRASFDVRACVEDALDLHTAFAFAKNIELVGDVADGVPDRVLGDATRCRQVLVNLVSNAVKFTRSGQIVVRVASRAIKVGNGEVRDDEAAPKADAEGLRHELHFEVEDSGDGIPSDRIDAIFEPFEQGDTSTTREHGGTGLGLAICRRLAEMMGGRAWVDSKPGIGSTFHFTVLVDDDPILEPETHGGDSQLLRGAVALVVVASQAQRGALHTMLGRLELKVEAVATANEAVERAGAAALDVAIVDRAFLDDDRLRAALALAPGLRVVVLQRPGVRAPLSLGPTPMHVVTKPVRFADLKLAVTKAFGAVTKSRTEAPSGLVPLGEVRPLKILVAEDNPVNQRVAVLLLDRLGYRADVASDGDEAMSMVRQYGYDVVFMDMQMPVLDGLDATRALRAELGPAMPHVIALTASAAEEDREACFGAGMSDFLSKPIRIAELVAVLRRVP